MFACIIYIKDNAAFLFNKESKLDVIMRNPIIKYRIILEVKKDLLTHEITINFTHNTNKNKSLIMSDLQNVPKNQKQSVNS